MVRWPWSVKHDDKSQEMHKTQNSWKHKKTEDVNVFFLCTIDSYANSANM